VLDGGPDAFVAQRPEAAALCKELGLGERMIGTTERNRKVYIRQGGEMHPLPEGLVLAIPTRVLPLARTRLFSWPGKIRMGFDLVIPRGKLGDDESVGSFIRRRLGKEALERLAEPLLGGIYAGNVDALSLQSTFPQLLELEQKHRSLILGALAQKKARGPAKAGPPPSTFTSLLGGMGELPETLAREIEAAGATVRTNAPVVAVERAGEGARLAVKIADGDAPLLADDVILCAPAFAAADALDGLDREMSAVLREIPYLSTATISIGFARADVPHPLDATGLILPKGEKREALAVTFSSSKWVSRAPNDVALIRIFAGGHRNPSALAQSDDELVAMARRELDALLGIRAKPIIARVFRYERANPQPILGHARRLQKLRDGAARHPGLHLAGAAFEGVGIPDCVRQANEVAKRIAASSL
jgi:oxygen-dependent protoporphyrinogen oxidase